MVTGTGVQKKVLAYTLPFFKTQAKSACARKEVEEQNIQLSPIHSFCRIGKSPNLLPTNGFPVCYVSQHLNKLCFCMNIDESFRHIWSAFFGFVCSRYSFSLFLVFLVAIFSCATVVLITDFKKAIKIIMQKRKDMFGPMLYNIGLDITVFECQIRSVGPEVSLTLNALFIFLPGVLALEICQLFLIFHLHKICLLYRQIIAREMHY